MTEKEIIDQLHIDHKVVTKAVRTVSEKLPSVKEKFYEGRLYPKANFSLEEVEAIYKELGCNELQVIYMRENFTTKGGTDIYEIKGTKNFLEAYKKDPEIRCCNTCKFCIGKVGESKMPKPFCEVYDKYLKSFNANVYEDYCSSYLRIKLPKPRVWFKQFAPINLNIFGETDTINGISKEKMYSPKRSVPGKIVRVNQVGFDSDVIQHQ